jgi:5'-nucleotidase
MQATPRILVTNDDGYRSDGIQTLTSALEAIGETWSVAPDSEQSAVSHSLTLDRPLRVEKLAERRFAVNGTPTDCVAVAVMSILKDRPPDLVVSGINYGVNMGADVHYSGTVAAAFEGLILGVPALAVSQQLGQGMTFTRAAAFACELAEWCLAVGLPGDRLLNVNIPVGVPRGVRLTRLGVREYTEGVIETTDPRGRTIYWIGGGDPVWEATSGTDFHELAEGYISVTPLSLDLTETSLLEQLAADKPDWMSSYAGKP